MAFNAPASQSSAPSVSLVVNATSADVLRGAAQEIRTASQQARVQTTWIVEQPQQAKVLAGAAAEIEFAASVSARSPQRLRSELSNLQAGIEAVTGQQVCVVAGDPQQLRSRASLLADLGIVAVVSNQQTPEGARPPRQLPCGLWQLEPLIALPRPRSRWSFLPSKRPSLQQLPGGSISTVVAIDLSEASPRDVQLFARLILEAGQASRRQQLSVVGVRYLAVELSDQHEVKPQRSILRRAA